MKLTTTLLIAVSAFASICPYAVGQTVLFDFEEDQQGWGSYGAITTDKGSAFFDDTGGFGLYHIGDFSQPDTGNFGIVDVSPLGLNLSPYGGLSVQVRFIDVPGFDPFVGVRKLDFVVATGEDDTEEEFFAPQFTMTQDFQTVSFPFSAFHSTLDGLAPTAADLSNIRIKLVVFNINGTGLGELDYDQVVGLAPVAADNADFNGDHLVDGADLLVWQRHLGSGTTLAQGDANHSSSVTSADLAIWKTQFGTPGGATAVVASVPEPASLSLLALAALACGAIRRRAVK